MQTGGAATIAVRLQIIDMEPFALDLEIPAYLAVGDLTHRLAMDAGLKSHWEDGTRRTFYLRARGRVLLSEEKLQDLGIVPFELLHLLPQPPAQASIQELAPDYPAPVVPSRRRVFQTVAASVQVALWLFLWSFGLSLSHGPLVVIPAAIAMGILVTNVSRHFFGESATAIRVPAGGLLLFIPLLFVVTGVGTYWGALTLVQAIGTLASGFIGGLSGVLIAWLAWYGAVESLPEVTVAHAILQEQEEIHACGICGGAVDPSVRSDCRFKCGRVFHVGCYGAQRSLSTQEGCAICGFQPG